MSDKKVICWDLDETLGHFRRIGYKLMGQKVPQFEQPISLRYGLTDLLSSLSSKGYQHFVTTSARSGYAEEVLRRTGLAGYFTGVLGKEVICSEEFISDGGFGKLYRPVAKIVGFSDEQAASDMIVIGNAPGDQPADISGLVFIQDRNSVNNDSVVASLILERLNELGKNNFNNGFAEMYRQAKIEQETVGDYSFERRTYEAGKGIKVNLDYETNSQTATLGKRINISKISGIQAEEYRKKPILG